MGKETNDMARATKKVPRDFFMFDAAARETVYRISLSGFFASLNRESGRRAVLLETVALFVVPTSSQTRLDSYLTKTLYFVVRAL